MRELGGPLGGLLDGACGVSRSAHLEHGKRDLAHHLLFVLCIDLVKELLARHGHNALGKKRRKGGRGAHV